MNALHTRSAKLLTMVVKYMLSACEVVAKLRDGYGNFVRGRMKFWRLLPDLFSEGLYPLLRTYHTFSLDDSTKT